MGSRISFAVLVLVALAWAGFAARADTVTMKDGTVIQGVVITQGDKYWIKKVDGNTQTVAIADVASLTKGAGTSTTPGAPGAAAGVPDNSGEFTAAQRKVSDVSTALQAVKIWQAFLDKFPTDPNAAAAQAELDRWKGMAKQRAEKINGKWVQGDERKAIVEKANGLMREAWGMMQSKQTLPALRKMEEAARIYPNSFEINFSMGYVQILAGKHNEAIRFLQQARRINPKSAETLNNLGVANMQLRQYVDGINFLLQAAELGDSAPLCQNLVNGIAALPASSRNTPQIKPAIDAAMILASKYGVTGPSGVVTIIGLPARGAGAPPGDAEGRGGTGMWSGTGFFINDAGLIVTNRHVVKGATTMVVMVGDVRTPAEVVKIDEEQDLALVKLKTVAAKTPFVQLAKADNPGDGAECTVLGFPMLDQLGGSIKVTRGIVSSGNAREEGADVMTDAKVNPGNSGGPMLDRYGNVLGVVTMKTANAAFQDSYGMAISAGKVRKFLAKNKVTVDAATPGAAALSAEEIAAKVKPATVCIICTGKE
jgi:S1-C subfamily serine protease